ncbi:hypothetical protein COU89_02925 [Candidatus Roizmanbacteria bacterium CG10_big_fil_rev_8_21_14_0_10_45_7]|uniref:Glycosyltransferase RgtA/B/C/D-like domain-containing protein n=1 Tax=Candidatus Roizmanbacteria bacterium CG10_big_fil_rev_8_21_14_0_10_45_7 TaxID=1974854 RepID=A0A2M8KUD2_9BACT|nr:MAG: hypothetical protein COU89_02925 [Candidatus Roizmanbacteria bacterium CG10_big_fil_rev_8_21_14_0_10_45_7]
MSDTLILIIMSLGLYSTGILLYSVLIGPFWKKHDVLITLPVSWVLGNGFWMLILLGLAGSNLLSLITVDRVLAISAILTLTALFFVLRMMRMVPLLIIALTVFILWPVIEHASHSYLIEWDAIAMWFLKAKSWYLSSGMHDNTLYTSSRYLYSERSHAIGVPLMISVFYRSIGHVNDQIAQLYLVQYYVLLTIALLGFLKKRSTTSLSWFSLWPLVLFFMISPTYIRFAASGYLDITIALVIACVTGLWLTLYATADRKESLRLALLTIVVGATACFIKNEGTVVTGLAGLATLAVYLFKYRRLTSWEWVGLITAGVYAVLGIALWRYIQQTYGIAIYLGQNIQAATMLARIKPILFHYLDTLYNTSGFGMGLVVLFIVMITTITISVMRRTWHHLTAYGIPLILLLSYTGVYLITPLNFSLQLTSSFERLVLQLIPALILSTGYVLRNLTPPQHDLAN